MQAQQAVILVDRAATLRSARLPQHMAAVAVVLVQQRLALAVAEEVSVQRVQVPVRLVLTEAVTVAVVVLQQA